MGLTDIEKYQIKKAMAVFMERRRPPVSIRSKVDLGYRIVGQSVTLFSIRPKWDEPEIIMEYDFAKTTYVRTRNVWKIYWLRSDLKWHEYDPAREVSSVEEFLKIVDEDAYSCFFE